MAQYGAKVDVAQPAVIIIVAHGVHHRPIGRAVPHKNQMEQIVGVRQLVLLRLEIHIHPVPNVQPPYPARGCFLTTSSMRTIVRLTVHTVAPTSSSPTLVPVRRCSVPSGNSSLSHFLCFYHIFSLYRKKYNVL